MNRAIAAEPEKFPGVKDVVELAQKELFDPLGMKDSSWVGEGNIASNLFSSVRDMARLGQLVLQRGRWQGKQLIDEEYLYRMTHPSFEDANTGYGYLTYVNAAANWSWPTSTADTYCAPFGQWPSYPHRPFFEYPNTNGGVPGERKQRYDIAHNFASGTGGQKFVIYRGLDMVIAIRNGAGSVGEGGTAADQFSGHKTVWNALRPAMLALDPVYKGDEAAFCQAYRRSEYAPDLREPWFKEQETTPTSTPNPSAPGAGGSEPKAPCTGTRTLRIPLRIPHSRHDRILWARVTANGKQVALLRGRKLLRPHALAGVPRNTRVRVEVLERTAKRNTLLSVRTFRRAC
jgi:hypothetical protein